MDYEQKYKKALEKAKKALKHYEKPEYKDILPYAKADFESFFEELKENEDERIREALLKVFSSWDEENFGPDDLPIKDIIAWLEKQGEQKPAWSKNDDEHINSLLKRLEGLCRNEFVTTRFAISEDEDWLKELKERYTWKPSDAQVEALQESIGIVGELTPRGECLKELEEQLKKLREE